MEICCISDLHGYFPDVGSGDLLIICGDLTARDQINQYVEFYIWLAEQNYIHKILIAGNHDNEIQKGLDYEFANENIYYLEDSGMEIEGLKIWGSPWSKTFEGMNPHCKAFTCDTEEELAEKWAMIPDDTDILITHSPPYGILDEVKHDYYSGFVSNMKYTPKHEHVGSKSLFDISRKLKNLKLFVFGHIHEGYGMIDCQSMQNHLLMSLTPDKPSSLPFIINASHVNERYQPVNKPIRVIL